MSEHKARHYVAKCCTEDARNRRSIDHPDNLAIFQSMSDSLQRVNDLLQEPSNGNNVTAAITIQKIQHCLNSMATHTSFTHPLLSMPLDNDNSSLSNSEDTTSQRAAPHHDVEGTQQAITPPEPSPPPTFPTLETPPAPLRPRITTNWNFVFVHAGNHSSRLHRFTPTNLETN